MIVSSLGLRRPPNASPETLRRHRVPEQTPVPAQHARHRRGLHPGAQLLRDEAPVVGLADVLHRNLSRLDAIVQVLLQHLELVHNRKRALRIRKLALLRIRRVQRHKLLCHS